MCYHYKMNKQNDFNFFQQSGNYQFAHSCTSDLKKENYYKHSHTNYELYVFFGGEVSFIIENNVYNLTEGTVLLIPPHTYHYASLKNTDIPYNRMVLNFNRVFVYPELYAFIDSGSNPFAWIKEKHNPLLSDLENNFNTYNNRDNAILMQLFLNRLLIDMKYSKKSSAVSQSLNPTVGNIIAYINEHINEPLNIKTIADNVFLNQSYLSQLFNKYMKIGVMDYVKQKKIYLAEEMIRSDGISPTEASRRLGFADYSTFYRLYKKYLKEVPSSNTKKDVL